MDLDSTSQPMDVDSASTDHQAEQQETHIADEQDVLMELEVAYYFADFLLAIAENEDPQYKITPLIKQIAIMFMAKGRENLAARGHTHREVAQYMQGVTTQFLIRAQHRVPIIWALSDPFSSNRTLPTVNQRSANRLLCDICNTATPEHRIPDCVACSALNGRTEIRQKKTRERNDAIDTGNARVMQTSDITHTTDHSVRVCTVDEPEDKRRPNSAAAVRTAGFRSERTKTLSAQHHTFCATTIDTFVEAEQKPIMHALNGMHIKCVHCSALMFNKERVQYNPRLHPKTGPQFGWCCKKGKVRVPPVKPPPQYLQDLLTGGCRQRLLPSPHTPDKQQSRVHWTKCT